MELRDKVTIVGIGETEYTKWGVQQRSEFSLACEAILKALDDAGLTVRDLDGFCSHSDDRNDPTSLATTIGVPHVVGGLRAGQADHEPHQRGQ